MSLYHFTCTHSQSAIGDAGYLVPPIMRMGKTDRVIFLQDPILKMTSQVVWMTTLEKPERMALGLTSFLVCCDRAGHRYRVTDEEVDIRPWSHVRKDWPVSAVRELESLPGCKPWTWWLSRGPVAVEYAPLPVGRSRARAS